MIWVSRVRKVWVWGWVEEGRGLGVFEEVLEDEVDGLDIECILY